MAKDNQKGRMRKVLKIIVIVILVLIIVCVTGFYFLIKHIMTGDDVAKAADPGNAAEYDLENVTALEDSPLADMNI